MKPFKAKDKWDGRFDDEWEDPQDVLVLDVFQTQGHCHHESGNMKVLYVDKEGALNTDSIFNFRFDGLIQDEPQVRIRSPLGKP